MYTHVHKVVLYEYSRHQTHVKFVHFATTRARGYIYIHPVGRREGADWTPTGTTPRNTPNQGVDTPQSGDIDQDVPKPDPWG